MRQKWHPAWFSGNWVDLRTKQLIGKKIFSLSGMLSSHRVPSITVFSSGLWPLFSSWQRGICLCARGLLTQMVGSQNQVNRGGAHSALEQLV